MSEILFKSEISSQLKKERKWPITGFVVVIYSLYLTLLMFLVHPPLNPFLKPSPIFIVPLTSEYIHIYIILNIPLVLIVWFALQYFGSFLVIYTNGIGIVTPFRFKMQRFVPWNSIKEIRIFNNDEIRGKEYNYYKGIYIFLKEGNKSLRISELRVDKIQKAYKIMVKHIEPIQKPEFCKNHPQIKSLIQCRSCGGYFCDECVEIKEIFVRDEYYGSGRIYQKCLNCNFEVALKRMAIIYFIAIIIPIIAMILLYLNLFFDLQNYLYGEIHSFWYLPGIQIQYSFSGNVIGIFSTTCAIISIFLILPTPFAYTYNIINLIKAWKMERLKVKYRKKSLVILSILAILITFYYSLWFIQLSIAWFGGYLIYLSIFTIICFLYEYFGITLSL